MLPDHLTQLLTAYLDGEANPSQRKTVQGLLEKSAEAQTLFRQLQEDAQRLRGLPRHQLDGEFSTRVLQAIADQHPRHAQRLARLGIRPYPTWLRVAVAASVLLVIGLGSYLYVDASRRSQADQAARNEISPQSQPKKPSRVNPGVGEIKRPEPAPKADLPPQQAVPTPAEIAKTEVPSPPAKPPVPRKGTQPPSSRPELATPALKTEGLEVVRPGIGLDLALHDLDQGALKERLRKELRRENSFRLELFCQGNGKVPDRLKAAFKSVGVRLVIEPEAQVRLKNHRLRSDYALYTEGLTADELARVLESLGKIDKQAEAKRRSDGQFDRLLVWPFTPTDRKEVMALLGFDPVQTPPPRPRAPLGVDIRKPVSEGTAAQVAQSLAGQGTPRPEPGKAVSPKPPERLALLVPYLPNRPKPPASREIKQFLDNRKERQSGPVHLFLVLRGVSG